MLAEYHTGVNWKRTVDIINALRSGGAQTNHELKERLGLRYEEVSKITRTLRKHDVIENISFMPKGFGRESLWNLTANFIGSFAKRKARVGL